MAEKEVIIHEAPKAPSRPKNLDGTPSFKFHYFNLRARGEITRLIFAYAGVEYEERRIEFPEWPKIKPTTPFGQLPVLEVDGVFLPQSCTIARFLARRHGLVGKDDWEGAQVDMIVDYISDNLSGIFPAVFEQNQFKKQTMIDKLIKGQLKPLLTKLEDILKENGTGYLVGDQLTWGDLLLFSILDIINDVDPTLVKSFELLHSLTQMVQDIPSIKTYLENRPKTLI